MNPIRRELLKLERSGLGPDSETLRRTIRGDGTMLLIERILKPANQPDPARFADMEMLVFAPGGRERTESEYRALLTEAGFSLRRVIPTAGLSIIESRPI